MNLTMKNDKWFMVFIIFGLVLIFNACTNNSGPADASAGQAIPAVEAVLSQFGSLPLTQRLSGIVEAKNQVDVYPELSAIIAEVYVKNGDMVAPGDPLVRLRNREFEERVKQATAGYQIAQAQLKQAEAQLIEVQSELKRTETLAAQNLTSSSGLEAMRTRAISAEANVALAKARVEQAAATVEERNEELAQTVIRSPISGSVGNRNAEVGMLVSGSNRLFTLGELENVRVKVVLTDRMLNYIEIGQRAEIAPEHGQAVISTARLSRISPFLNPVTHSTDAEIDLANPNQRLKSGMFVTVDIFYGESEQATLVPLSALYENPLSGKTGVYLTEFQLQAGKTSGDDGWVALQGPVDFKFIPVEVLARGRMEAGIRGIEPEQWVITLGQNLIGAAEGPARVRTVDWNWVTRLQNLQREDLMDGLIKNQVTAGSN